ncbi:hypothetical protein ACHWQZ_G012392 [Mnemiopsis leidyi]
MGHNTVIYLDTVASHLTYVGDATQVSPGANLLLLERWVIRLEQAGTQQGGERKLLLQALHSHLHFSQLSAWLSSSHGRFPANVSYSINSEEKLQFYAAPDQHRFPIVSVGENKCLIVEVNSLPRSTLHLPNTDPDQVNKSKTNFGEKLNLPAEDGMKPKPRMKSPSIKSPSSCSQQVKKRLFADMGTECVPASNGAGDTCVLSPGGSFRKYDPLNDSGIYSPNSSYRSSLSTSRDLVRYRSSSSSPNLFHGDESSLDSGIMPPTTSSTITPLSVSPTPYNSPQHSLIESSIPFRSTPYPWALSDMFTVSSPPKLAFKPPENSVRPQVVSSSPTPSSSKSKSPEPLESLNFSPIKFDSPMKFTLFKSSQRRSSSLCIAEEEEDEFINQSPLPYSSTDDVRASWHGNPFLDKPSFKRSTSLPLLSSPVLYRKSCCRTGKRVNGQTVLNSNKNYLLGSFEENILKDRFTPCGSIPGFKFKMSVSGLFSSPSITLPFVGNFYSFSDQYCPSPYTGCVKLDTCGTHGYQISKQGRIQATIFDPENSVIRIFLVPYDVREMPARSQTFIRQRIQAVSADGNKTLQYHLHFRLMSGRSSRVYLHTEIRVLFVRGTSTIDSSDSESGGPGTTMVTENCIPSNPRYSTISKTKRSS